MYFHVRPRSVLTASASPAPVSVNAATSAFFPHPPVLFSSMCALPLKQYSFAIVRGYSA